MPLNRSSLKIQPLGCGAKQGLRKHFCPGYLLPHFERCHQRLKHSPETPLEGRLSGVESYRSLKESTAYALASVVTPRRRESSQEAVIQVEYASITEWCTPNHTRRISRRIRTDTLEALNKRSPSPVRAVVPGTQEYVAD